VRKYYCDSCKKEIEFEDEIKKIKILYNHTGCSWVDCTKDSDEYELCNDCYKAMKLELKKIFNWRNRLR